jgi:hypothetical protein
VPAVADDVDVVVAHPISGELIEQLDQQPAAVLADALFLLRERRLVMRQMEGALEAELRRRVAMRDRAVFVFGDYEVSNKSTSRREWDADELEGVLRELLDAGTLHAAELTEVIHHETRVSGKEAQRLLGRLTGDALKAVERCFRWRQGPARVEVERSVQLIPEGGGNA